MNSDSDDLASNPQHVIVYSVDEEDDNSEHEIEKEDDHGNAMEEDNRINNKNNNSNTNTNSNRSDHNHHPNSNQSSHHNRGDAEATTQNLGVPSGRRSRALSLSSTSSSSSSCEAVLLLDKSENKGGRCNSRRRVVSALELLDGEQQKQQQNKTRKSTTAWTENNNTKRTKRIDNNYNNKNNNNNHPFEIVTRLIEQALYEVHVDPYRGMQAQENVVSSEDELACPWRVCQVVRKVDNNYSTHRTAVTAADAIVNSWTGTHCPCLSQWTATARKKIKSTTSTASSHHSPKGRKEMIVPLQQPSSTHAGNIQSHHLHEVMIMAEEEQELGVETDSERIGTRPEARSTGKSNNKTKQNNNNYATLSSNEASTSSSSSTPTEHTDLLYTPEEAQSQFRLRCACDYNPWCLLTSGGVMNALLTDLTSHNPKQRPSPRRDRWINRFSLLADSATRFFPEKELHKLQQNRHCVFRRSTQARLQLVRKSIQVPEATVRAYLARTLHNLTTIISVDECIQRLVARHSSLVFANPLPEMIISQPTECPTEIQLAAPPGIQNLGATCYLNTQLQCLAQCLVFVMAVFTWQPFTTTISPSLSNDESMKTVLLLFQSLLAQLHAGGQRVYNAIEFASALGLDHHEQQDPNEFSRLFLELMDESFRRNAALGVMGGGGNAIQNNDDMDDTNKMKSGNHPSQAPLSFSSYVLKDLLSYLFQGTTRYETTCLLCGTKSYRYENFRDLNLPIIERLKRKSVMSTLRTMLSGVGARSTAAIDQPSDSSLQDCLDVYCGSEDQLEGDNQYWCSTCNQKCDATRKICFTKLPPVLNIQLCRYIFDRKSLSKKKLNDRVLLSTELLVASKSSVCSSPSSSVPSCSVSPSPESMMEEEDVTRRYRLCAVMRHQGNSAYSGHYVAEAMDWCTGQWFEFNDENVTYLENGPSCTWCPDCDQKSAATSAVRSSGTERDTLSDKEVEGGERPIKRSFIGSKDAYNMYYVDESFLAQSIIDNLRQDDQVANIPYRESSAKDSTDLMSALGRVTLNRLENYSELERLCRRDEDESRKYIQNHISLREDVLPHLDAVKINSLSESVWVHGEQLRKYFALDFSQPIVPRKTLLCSHHVPGLHPRVARQGKLLPRAMFDILVQKYNSLCSESASITATVEELDSDDGIIITPSSNMVCQICREEYRRELSEKTRLFSSLMDLYNKLDPKIPDFSLEYDNNEIPKCENSQYAYVLSRSFISGFRKRFNLLVKSIGASDTMLSIEDKTVKTCTECLAEGLDALPLSALRLDLPLNKCMVMEDDLDPLVNFNLTCPHGRLIVKNKRLYRHLPFETWEVLHSLFPRALMLRNRRYKKGNVIDLEEEHICPECQAQDSVDDSVARRIISLVSFSGLDLSLSQLDMSAVVNAELDRAECEEPRVYRIVHKDDIRAWRKFANVARRKQATSAEKLKTILSPTTSCERKPISFLRTFQPCQIRQQKLDTLLAFMRPIVCSKHSKPIERALFGSITSSEVWQLCDRVSVIDERTYTIFLSALATVAVILSPLKDGEDANSRSFEEDYEEACKMIEDFDLKGLHPQLKTSPTVRSNDVECTAIDGETSPIMRMFDVSPCVCKDNDCNHWFTAWEESEYPSMNESTLESEATGRAMNAGSLIDPEVQEIDCDKIGDEDFSLRVFNVAADADVNDQLANLAHCAGVESDDLDLNESRRRSTRKRNIVYPVGAVTSETKIRTKLQNNLASLRLALMERCQSYELNHSLKALVSRPRQLPFDGLPVNDWRGERLPILASNTIDLLFELNDVPFGDLIESSLGSKLGDDFKPSDHLFLVRQARIDPSSMETSQEEIMEVLIATSNTTIADRAGTAKSKKHRKAERGFHGTLLTGASRQIDPNKNESKLVGDAEVDDLSELQPLQDPLALEMHVPRTVSNIAPSLNGSLEMGKGNNHHVIDFQERKVKRRKAFIDDEVSLSPDDDNEAPPTTIIHTLVRHLLELPCFDESLYAEVLEAATCTIDSNPNARVFDEHLKGLAIGKFEDLIKNR